MNNQLQINFFNGNKLFFDKNKYIDNNLDNFYYIRRDIQIETDNPPESLVLFHSNNETPLKEYNNEDLLFCLVKPVAKFSNKQYKYTIKINKIEITLDELKMDIVNKYEKELTGKCTITNLDNLKSDVYPFEEIVEIEEEDGELSEFILLNLDIMKNKDYGIWNFFASGEVIPEPYNCNNYPYNGHS